MDQTAELTHKQDIADLVAPLDTITTSRTGKTLGSVLTNVTSSHSAVFIFDETDEFTGLVSPYKTLYASNFPYSTQVESVLLKPPAITRQTSIADAVGHMLATRIYTLPVFNDVGEPDSVIRAEDVLKHVAGTRALLRAVSDNIKPNKPITAPITSSVGEVYSLLKEKGVSRIVLTEESGALAGIVTRSDLMHAFIKPSVRRRFAGEGTVFGFYSRASEKKFRTDYPVRPYAVTMVSTLPARTGKSKIVTHLIESEHNSVVLVDSRHRPTGFLSIRDLLQAIAIPAAEETVPLIMNLPDSVAASHHRNTAQEYLAKFGSKLNKRIAVEKMTVTTEELKNTKAQAKALKITIMVTPVAGEPLIASVEDWDFLDGLQSATTLIEKQRRRLGRSVRETRTTRR